MLSLALQKAVARVRTPVGARISVAVSSVETAMNTIAKPASAPGRVRGSSTRAKVRTGPAPSARAAWVSSSGAWAMEARMLTIARGMKRIAYAATSTTLVWYTGRAYRIVKVTSARATTTPGSDDATYVARSVRMLSHDLRRL